MQFTPQNSEEQAMLDLLEMAGYSLAPAESLPENDRAHGYTGYGVLWRGEHFILVESIQEAFDCLKEKLL